MEKRQKILTRINNTIHSIDSEKAFMPLGTFLRNEASLCGTKIVCAEGDCGACTVLVAKNTDKSGKLEFQSVNSCIIPLYLLDGASVVTVEGLASSPATKQVLHEVQEKMIDNNGAQCGYCTPGFICAMADMTERCKLEKKPITEKKAKNFLTGNLCRCTGYQPILNAALAIDLDKVELMQDRFHDEDWLKEVERIKKLSVEIDSGGKKIFLPTTLDEALRIKAAHADMRVISGSTDIGVVVNKGKLTTTTVLGLYHIKELKKMSVDDSYFRLGATVTLTEFEDFLEKNIPEMSRMIRIFACPQIKNQGTVVGNVVNASPIADTIPFLMVSDSIIVLQGLNGLREVLMKNFYTGYKKLDIRPDELVVEIKIPKIKAAEKVKLYKISMRKDMDISAVTFGSIVEVQDNKITKSRITLGGIGATVLRLSEIESKMIGEDFSRATYEKYAATLSQYISPLSDLRASKEYRMKVAHNFFLKFYDEVSGEMEAQS